MPKIPGGGMPQMKDVRIDIERDQITLMANMGGMALPMTLEAKEMKKICFFSGDITRSGGTERVAAMIANGLQQTGRYEIVFLSLVEKNKDTFFPLDSAVSRYALGKKWISPGPGYLKLLPKIRRFIRQQNIDIIVDIDIVLDILSIPACRGMKVKIVSWDHFNFDFEMSVFYRRMILKYSVYHNTGSREVSHVLFLQIARMCNTHPFSSTVLSPHPAFLLSYSVHRSSGKKFLPCLRQSLTLSASWYSCFLPDL